MQNKSLQLFWPSLKGTSPRIYPVFIPFAGCTRRCIFCAQHLQSGHSSCEHGNITQKTLDEAERNLKARQEQNLPPLELAFYGGTFTALAPADFALCLSFSQKLFRQGLITGARCSTRPDALTNDSLTALKEAAFHTIELGVQSFDNTALNIAQRHYTEDTIYQACDAIHKNNFTLAIQLMPGMPGVSEAIFLKDVQKALEQGAHFLRFYPCQVIASTELENLWRNGKYSPWSLEQCISALSEAWLKAHLAKVPVIRMGLAPQPELEEHILAGPRHEALGNMVQAEALFSYISRKISQYPLASEKRDTIFPIQMTLPKSCQGYFGGHKQKLMAEWKKLGVQKGGIHWHEKEYIEILL